MFTDRVKVELSAGKGGNGVIAWRREKYIPKGGPTGGSGGFGGSVILEADEGLYSLDWFRNRRLLKAESGQQGGGDNRRGKSGRDLILHVPCGTLVKDPDTGEVLFDFTEHKQRWKICAGGRGGRGNATFKTSTNRAPNYCTPGKEGESRKVELELKLIADIGLVGFPNAGKSTLISVLASVRVKIAPYPFTTLKPNLGVIRREDYSQIWIADIPGIIQNAHKNKGLGFDFLRHIDRTKLLLFVLDASGIDGRTPTEDFRVLRNEIEQYNPEMLNRPYLVILNKIDTEEAADHIKEFYQEIELPSELVYEISAANKDGTDQLLERLKTMPLTD